MTQFSNEYEQASFQSSDVVERRSDRRRKVLKGGNLYFNKGYGAYACTIRNLSNDGALIEMEDSSGLPTSFEFLVNGETRPVTATIAWRSRGK